MGCGIYKITNIINKKTYIGSSVDVKSRKYKHFWMLEKNIHDNEYLQKSYNKYGKEGFEFEVLEECENVDLIEKENHYILFYKSNNQSHGYNLATVNDFRRNTYNNEVKVKISKHNLKKNGNINTFSLQNIETNKTFIFDNLVDATNYLIENGYAKGNPRNVRQKLSSSLRMKKVSNGYTTKTIRKTCYKHKFKIIN